MNDSLDEKQLRLENKKLGRELRRLRKDNEMLRMANDQSLRTLAYIQKDSARQVFYNNQMLRTSPYILILTDDALHTVMVSDVYYEHSDRYDKDKVMRGVALDEALDGILEDADLKILMEKCNMAVKGRPIQSYLTCSRKNGEKTDWKVSVRRMISDGNVVGLNIMFVDMTDIVDAMEHVREADRAKTNFLANMSHEIRTPMNAINGMAEFILRDSSDEKARHNAFMIRSACRSLITIINDILDISKIETGKLEIIEDSYETAGLFADVSTMIKIRLHDRSVELVVNIDENMPRILYGDEIRLKQVLINLLGNAVKFTEKGYIELRAGFEKMDETHCELRMSVKDTGIGIRDEDRKDIFSSFTQVDTKRNRSVEGAGLGLAISRNLVEAMGGTISFESVYGEGTTFSFTVISGVEDWSPVGSIDRWVSVTKDATFRISFLTRDARVLIVDDNEMNLEVAEGILSPYDIDVVKASSGAEAMIRFQEREYDIVLMDHMMPVMDGVEAMKKIRSMPGGRDVAMVALTANVISGVEEEYRKMGFDDYLGKPIEPEAMEEILKKFLPPEKMRSVDEAAEEKRTDASVPLMTENLDDHIDKEVGLKYCMGSTSLLNKMLAAFVFTARCDSLEQLYREKNWEEYRIAVHSVKSTSLNIGATALHEEAKAIETAVKEDRFSYVDENHAAFVAYYRHLTALIEEHLKTLS